MKNFDQLLMSLTMALTHGARAYVSAANKMAGSFDLSHATAWPVLMVGRMGDGVRPGAVADALGLEPPSLVRVIDQLVEAGLIERHDDPSDRRAKTLHLTAAGRQCAARLEKALIPFRRKLFENVDPADIEACVRVLTALDVSIAQFEDAQERVKPS
jgi:MarR family transcriptional regulator for hemolysin